MGLPQGTVTFLFTDLEGSTRRWEAHPQQMKDALGRHDTIVRGAVESHDGVVFSTMGDGMAAVFGSARDAVRAVLAAQQGLAAEDWGAVTGLLAAPLPPARSVHQRRDIPPDQVPALGVPQRPRRAVVRLLQRRRGVGSCHLRQRGAHVPHGQSAHPSPA